MAADLLTSCLAFFVVAMGVLVSLWAIWYAIYYPNQWLSPVDKVIVITGCDSGIGLHLARHFHSKGSLVIATVLSTVSEGATRLKSELAGERFHLLQLDLKNGQQMAQTVRQIGDILSEAQLGLHALVNNAGVCILGELDFCTFDQIEQQISINLLGTIRFTKMMLPLLIQSKGRIVNVSSVNAVQSFPGISVYSATKRAIEGFSDGLRMELHKFGVQVVNVRLGDYARLTDIMARHRQVMAQQEAELDDTKRQLYGDYFSKYHASALANYGYFSPPSFEASSLCDDFEEAVYANISRRYLTSATWPYRMLIYFLTCLPIVYREALIRRFTNKMLDEGDKRKKTN